MNRISVGRWLARVGLVTLGITAGLVVLILVGLRVWLSNQPRDFQAQIEQFSPSEFVVLLRDTFWPASVADRGAWGRSPVDGRGDSPWVRRLSLDGRPRMLAIALAPELWLAYSTETASIHQLWRGGIDYTGPVYDARHGREPSSQGSAYLRAPRATAWRIRDEQGDWRAARVQWRGHGFRPDGRTLWLRYDLLAPDDPARVLRSVTESPDLDPAAAPPSTRLVRTLTLSPGAPIALAFDAASARPTARGDVETTATALVFPADARKAELSHAFDAPEIELVAASAATRLSEDAFTDHDCRTCHADRERITGPAWSEIAARHAGAHRDVAVETLATRIREGSEGRWTGSGMMPAHPNLSLDEARALAAIILDTPPSDAPAVEVETDEGRATWTYRDETDEPPHRLHPGLRAVPLDPPGFTPMVGGLAWLPDGRLGVSTWDPDGVVFALSGWAGDPSEIQITRLAEGLQEPLGLTVVNDAIYVMQKQEITQILDHDGDDRIDEYRVIANDWSATSNFHEFGFGLVEDGGALYATLSACVLNGGKSCREQTPDRGSVIRVPIGPDSSRPSRSERVARGLRTPDGIARSPEGAIFVTDNQGDWLPASKLVRVDQGAHFGWRGPASTPPNGPIAPPALWLPHNEIGNSPTQPLFLEHGPYASQVIFGDIYNGGLKRASLETIDGVLQGAAFHFSGGFEGPIHRLLATPDRRGFVVGQIGSHGNWGEPGKEPWGLERVELLETTAFEPLSVRLRPGGFRVELTRPLATDVLLDAGQVLVQDWYYVPAPIYGGPKYDLRSLPVDAVRVDATRRVIELDVPDLEAGRVVYLKLPDTLRSERGEPLWIRETWYTLNRLHDAPGVAAGPPAPPPSRSSPNTLTPEERAAGWRLLFDGRSFAGWKIYGRDDGVIEHWVIDDQALHFTRDVSFAGLILNHINPFVTAAVDLMTVERFSDFELSIDWRVSPGGNSGIFYAIPDESTRLSWDLALEMQVLDDDAHPDGQIERHRAGDLYDLQSLARGAGRPAGEWNTALIRVEGDRVRHWLNGVLTADLVRGSADWDAALAASKFDGTEGFGLAREGHVSLQDHGDPVWFRNVKIRSLAPDETARTDSP
jgi:cytochrome c551/c552